MRKRNLLKQEDVARHLGITRAAYGMYETGSRDVPHDKQVLIAKFYDIPLQTLQSGTVEAEGRKPGMDTAGRAELMDMSKMDLVSHCLALQNELNAQRSRLSKLELEREETKRVLRGLMDR
ncbi:MAG: helix-turn-helix transcriptional regulator [Cyclobacteriaceae bacterium]